MSGPVEGPADLTLLQRKYIRNLWEYCQTPPTLGRDTRSVLGELLGYDAAKIDALREGRAIQ